MILRRYLGTLIVVWLFGAASVSLAAGDFEPRLFESADGQSLPYQIHVPARMEPGKRYPLVMFFHGAGQRGSDNQQQLQFGVGEVLAWSRRHDEPAIIVAPQVPIGQQWVDTPWGADSHSMPAQPSASMRQAIALMDEVRASLPVDEQRIYVTGLSMGGFGTWDIVQRMPDTFAAAVPVCGGGDAALAGRIKDVPVWVFHGDQDWVVKTKRSRDMVAALKKAGGKPRYTEYKGIAHDAWTPAYANQEMLQWMFEQRKK